MFVSLPVSISRRPYMRSNIFDLFAEMDSDWFPHANDGFISVDVESKEDRYIVKGNIPGFDKEDITIDLEENSLTIIAKKESCCEERNKQKKLVRCERYSGTLMRTILFDDDVVADEVKAFYRDGVITVELPKVKDAKSKKIRLKIE